MPAASCPLVSIVTPAYNEEQYLAECIESVLAQSYSNWNYLIVNNCSTDRTLAIASEYAARDSRIRVISTDALIPATANFNFALRRISPESQYCKVILGDDWIFPECLERMVALMEEHPSIGIAGAYGLQGQWVLWEGVPYASKVVPGREICRERLLGGPYVFGSATSVLFRSDLVRGRERFYDETIEHASDSDACFDLLKACDFGFVHQVLTFSRVREGSLLEGSKALNASAADMLRELVVYGPVYLSKAEYSERLHEAKLKYYDFLATNLLHSRDERFWSYHKAKLKEAGVGFSRFTLAGAVVRKMANRLRVRSGGLERWGL
jgi:glycosyltransferase involved in cell wall biosynthesis